jgi:hypothetical protein
MLDPEGDIAGDVGFEIRPLRANELCDIHCWDDDTTHEMFLLSLRTIT